jgi:glycosyltransferase involved in cell wall biosynthesis
MKILVVNNHYFNYRGADRYFFNVMEGLKKAGHQVVPFSFRYDATLETPYSHYFPEPITGFGPFLLKDIKLSPLARLKTALKMFRNTEVEDKFREILRDTKPDLVYTIYLSFTFLPKILQIAKKEFGLPVLYRLSDYHMFCASYLLFRDNQACTECLTRPWAAIQHKCVHGSASASTLRALQIQANWWNDYYQQVDYFICPSAYMKGMLVRHGGFSDEKVLHLPTFTQDLYKDGQAAPSLRYGLYFGAIVRAKGVEVLLKAFNRISRPTFGLKLVGDVEADYGKYLSGLLDEPHRKLVSIGGELKGEALWEVLRGCSFVVHPVLWFENMPNSILEAMSAGKPVIVANIGSMPELVEEGVNGTLVPPGNEEALTAALEKTADPDWVRRMSEGARARYLKNHSPEGHLAKLTELMKELVENKSLTTKAPSLPSKTKGKDI